MGPKKRKSQTTAAPPGAKKQKQDENEIPEWMMRDYECPVCLEVIMDPPIYVCENIQGHSVCERCHEALKAEGKCPVCRESMANRRNMQMETVVEKLTKQVCKFEGCGFKKSDGSVVKKHEEDCPKRLVVCEHSQCQSKVGLHKFEDHLTGETHKLKPKRLKGFKVSRHFHATKDTMQKCIYPFKIKGQPQCPTFLLNWRAIDRVTTMFWVSCIGPKDEAKNYMYTLQVESAKDKKAGRKAVYLFKATTPCLPCDLTTASIKKARCALWLWKELIDAATEEGSDGKLYYWLTIKRN